MNKWASKVSAALLLSLCTVSGVVASESGSSSANEPIKMSEDAREIIAHPDGTLKKNGVMTLQDYIVQEKEMYDWLFKNHPIMKYKAEGRLIGKLKVADRGEEWVHAGHGNDFQKYSKRKGLTSTMYRLPTFSLLEFPNKFVGPEKCGECHAQQYEKWRRSRHATTVRFPGEHPEVNNELTKSVFGPDTASILPKGITPDVIYCTIGHLRTKMGFFDAWLLRGTYHVVNGLLRDGTGTVVAGANQFQRTWANDLTPEVAKKIREFVPSFPVTLEEYGDNTGYVRGLASYAARYKKVMAFQSATSYCEVCHPWKFDFKTKEEFYAALGNAKELHKHTVSKGIACEECHGAGAHLPGGTGNRTSNCERCHQRFSFRPFLAEKYKKDKKFKYKAAEMGMTSKFKSAGPGCGTEGSQSYFTKHYEAGIRCTTCHDPHDVSGYVPTTTAKKGGVYNPNAGYLSSFYTKPALKKTCQECHPQAAEVAQHTSTHKNVKCASCHMPYIMSCENFYAIQYQDKAGFDTQRRSHIWKIDIHPTRKTLNPPPGQPRVQKRPKKYKDWYIAKNEEGHNFIDLMWACASTTWADKDHEDNKGCHSVVQSTLKESLHYKDQKRVFDEVMKWQKPIKATYNKTEKTLARIEKLRDLARITGDDKVEFELLVEKARENQKFIKKDGSWGVHGYKYLNEKAEAALAYAKKAESILSNYIR